MGTCACDSGYRGTVCDEVLPTQQPSAASGDNQTETPESNSAIDTKYLIAIICSVAAVIILALVIGLLFCR